MLMLPDDTEELARRLADKTGTAPLQAIRDALEARAAAIGLDLAHAATPRQPGRLKGSFTVPTGLFDPLPADELDLWWKEGA
jgi:hypothetical protein